MNSLERQADLARAIAIEEGAWADVIRLSGELARAAAPIARQGDTNCGAVLDQVFGALEAAGLYVRPSARRRGYAKQPIGATLRTAVFERDAYRCVSCATHLDLTVDHIHPEVLGGTPDLHNLQTLCRSCNASKGART